MMANQKNSPKKANKSKSAPRVTLSNGASRPSHFGGLGRGLDALISRTPTQGISAPAAQEPEKAAAVPEPPAVPSAPAESVRGSIIEVELSRIHPSPWQPRRVFDEERLQELADSIRAHGIIQPLVCRRDPGGNGYELIGGERRLRAATLLNLPAVPIIVIDAVDHNAAELALVENLQREDLNIIEEAEGYKALADRFHLTQQDIADRVGKARASVTNTLRLLDLPDEVKQMLGAGLLSTGHAKVLLGLSSQPERTEMARKCLSEGLTVRSLEKRIQKRLSEKPRREPVSDITPDYLKTLLEKLHARFATSVRITPSCTYANGKHGRGHLEIDYFNNDDLSRLLDLFGIDMNDF